MSVPERVKEMVRDILAREGGYVDDPDDTGGTTNHGISLKYAEGIGLDLDGDGDTDADDIRLVTPRRAAELYIEDFFFKPGFNRLPEKLQAQMFDIAVNSGPFRAYELLQMSINNVMPINHRISEDGRWGPKSREALDRTISVETEEYINDVLVGERTAFYQRIVERNSSQKKFLQGWVNRAEEFYSN